MDPNIQVTTRNTRRRLTNTVESENVDPAAELAVTSTAQPTVAIIIPEQPAQALPLAFTNRTVSLFDLGPMNMQCIDCGALHWLREKTTDSTAEEAVFELCCKKGDVNLPLFNDPPEYLKNLLQDQTATGRQFRENLRQYNCALAFTSVDCTTADQNLRPGITCFTIHGELYHIQGPLITPSDGVPR